MSNFAQASGDATGSLLRTIGSDTLISVVVPLHNEARCLDAFFREADRAFASLACQVEHVCVNDGSTDATLSLLQAKLISHPGLRIVDLSRNFGKEAAIMAGLAHARGHAVVLIDADLQDPPSLIPALLAKWQQGFDVVYGQRACRKSDALLKRWTARAFYRVFNALTDVRIPPGAGDFRLLDRRVVDVLLSLPERNRFTKGLFSWVGFRQTGVPFTRQPRAAGSSAWSYWRLLNFAIDGLTSFSIGPLRLAGLGGILVSMLGFGYAAFLTARTLIYGADVPGYASVMVVMMVLGGFQLFSLGLIGEYLGRLYMEAKQRPLFVVSDVYEQPRPEAAGGAPPSEPSRASGVAEHSLHATASQSGRRPARVEPG